MLARRQEHRERGSHAGEPVRLCPVCCVPVAFAMINLGWGGINTFGQEWTFLLKSQSFRNTRILRSILRSICRSGGYRISRDWKEIARPAYLPYFRHLRVILWVFRSLVYPRAIPYRNALYALPTGSPA